MSVNPHSIVAVVLAGGLGSRVRHLHPDLPKPMIPVHGRPFLEWIMRYLRQQQICKAIISTGHLAEIIGRHFARPVEHGLEVQCALEATPLGTAGGFLNAVAGSGERPAGWLVLNGDSLVFADLSPAVRLLNEPGADGVILGVRMADAARYGTLAFDESGQLLRFEEKRPGAGVINAGVYLLKPELLARFPSVRPVSFEKDIFPGLLAGGAQLRVHATDAPFLDIGTPESLKLAESFIRENFSSLQTA